jgi:hypothetical protein
MDMGSLHGWWLDVNVAVNLLIVFGYVLVPFTVMRYLELTTSVSIAGMLFFFTCAMTHLSMAFQFSGEKFMVFNHAIQAVSVVWFVVGFWQVLRAEHGAHK